MESKGMIRCIDGLGRVVLPGEIRHQMNLAEGDHVRVYSEGSRIILEKTSDKPQRCFSRPVIFKDGICPKCGQPTHGIGNEPMHCESCGWVEGSEKP